MKIENNELTNLTYEINEKKLSLAMDLLKQAIKLKKEVSFTTPEIAKDEDALALLISQFCQYDGQKIFNVSYNAFEDANYHSFNNIFEDLWDKTNHSLAHKFDFKIQVKNKKEKA
jgi:pyruvate formate-lyase activating enzyme-like uncharacterized protein